MSSSYSYTFLFNLLVLETGGDTSPYKDAALLDAIDLDDVVLTYLYL